MNIDCGSCQEILMQCDLNSFATATCTGQNTYIPNVILFAVILALVIMTLALIGIIQQKKAVST